MQERSTVVLECSSLSVVGVSVATIPFVLRGFRGNAAGRGIVGASVCECGHVWAFLWFVYEVNRVEIGFPLWTRSHGYCK